MARAETASRLRLLFTATIFLGSFLLFLVQPMVGRMILPRLGGAPQVWNSAMLFYQAVLLAGYGYAHLIGHWPLKRQWLVHLALFAAAAITLPVGLVDLVPPAASAQPMFWLLGLLALSIGPLFFVVSAQAPLMQSWFATSDDARAADPYFLYAASNFGSLLALVAYPFAVEPFLTLKAQAWLWSAGFALLALLVVLCGLKLGNRQPVSLQRQPVAWRKRLLWVALAAVPSGLLLSTTTHLTTDIMAMPLLWVVPLALYLVTFIIAFSDSGGRTVHHAQFLAPPLLLGFGIYTFLSNGLVALLVASVNLVLFFYIALALHGRLAQLRPNASGLTEYYLWISVGGVVGGLFCALVAPVAFNWSFEHPILLVAAALLLPAQPLMRWIDRLWQRPIAGPLLIWVAPLIAFALSLYAGHTLFADPRPPFAVESFALLAALGVLAIGRRWHFAFYYAAMMLAFGGWLAISLSLTPGARYRSFFGIYAVETREENNVRQLLHGTTLHGVQSLDPELSRRPMSYYSPDSGVGQAMRALPKLSGRFANVGVVGLGAGSLACYAQPGQGWTMYEIDPTVVSIARDPTHFTYLSQCAPGLAIKLGDARLTLADAAPHSYDLLVIDAFSSDAIPLHLLTREAFDIYMRALKPGGLLLVHISNRYLDLAPVLASVARDTGWAARMKHHQPAKLPGIVDSPSFWVAMSDNDVRLVDMVQSTDGWISDWPPLEPRAGFRSWSDDFASIVAVLKYRG